MGRLLLETKHLSKRFCRRPELALRYTMRDILREFRRLPEGHDHLRLGEFWAVQDINLELRSGEVLGLIGHNGAGKSTLLNLFTGILRPTLGEIHWHTDNVVLIDQQAGLNPIQTGRENIYNMLSLNGVDSHKIHQSINEIIDYSGIQAFIDSAVGTYSTGMRLRLAFSIYTQLQPDVFIIDEALGGGDIQFQQKFENFLRDYIAKGGAILLVSHSLFMMQALCHRCILLHEGKIYQTGRTDDVLYTYHQLMGVKEQHQQQAMLLSGTPRTLAAPDSSATDEVANLMGSPDELFGSVEIEQVEIMAIAPDSEALHQEILPGSRVRIRMTCQSKLENLSVAWGVLLGRVSQSTPLAIMTSQGCQGDYYLKQGYNEFCCTIAQLPLLPGHYHLAIVVSVLETRALLALKGYNDAPFPFEVKGFADPTMNAAIALNCFLHVPVQWEQHSQNSSD